MGAPVIPVDKTGKPFEAGNPLHVTMGSGGGGMPSDAAWGGTGDGTVIAILKAIYAQNATMITLLGEIRDNTASV